ncbi:MAG: transcription termination factor NusA [Brevinematales bacterium]|nr:transcription termination factor NusA [Brevinematales bacterium]
MALGDIIEEFAKENKISEELAEQILKEAMSTAYKKKFGKTYENVEVKIDKKIYMFQLREVAETVEDEVLQISADEGMQYTKKKSLEPGDTVKIPIDVSEFGRQIAQIVKQVLKQRVNEIQKDILYNEFANKTGQVFIGKVKSMTDSRSGGYFISLEPRGVEAFLPYSECIPDESFDTGENVKFYLLEAKQFSRKGESQLILSRKREEFVKELLRLNIPEINDGTFTIRAVARKPGEVSKVVIDTVNDSIDPISVTVGKQGARIKPIRSELGSERIEIIRWNEEPRQLISNAVKASRVLKARIAEVYNIDLDMDKHEAHIVVADEFLAPLIGKGGSHQKMIEKVTGWKIHFRPYSEFEVEILEKQRQVDQILGITSETEEVEVIEEEKIPIDMLPFTPEQMEILRSAGFEDVVEIVEFSIEELANRCGISLDSAMELWKVIESNVEIEEEEA